MKPDHYVRCVECKTLVGPTNHREGCTETVTEGVEVVPVEEITNPDDQTVERLAEIAYNAQAAGLSMKNKTWAVNATEMVRERYRQMIRAVLAGIDD